MIAAKGLETATGQRLSRGGGGGAAEAAGSRSSPGPNFAGEVAAELPAASTLGCADPALGASAAAAQAGRARVYWTDDVVQVEVGGAVKNVLAIAAGIVAEAPEARRECAGRADHPRAGRARPLGRGRGRPARDPDGALGLGDLVLTAGSLTSRNIAFGHAIGRGADLAALRRHPGPLVEGVPTAAAVMRAGELGLDLPICAAVDAILAERLDIEAALAGLMSRPLKREAEPEGEPDATRGHRPLRSARRHPRRPPWHGPGSPERVECWRGCMPPSLSWPCRLSLLDYLRPPPRRPE